MTYEESLSAIKILYNSNYTIIQLYRAAEVLYEALELSDAPALSRLGSAILLLLRPPCRSKGGGVDAWGKGVGGGGGGGGLTKLPNAQDLSK